MFRATASTILNELGFREDAIERQLAHSDRNKVRASYNQGEYLEERRAMMQQWATTSTWNERKNKLVPIAEPSPNDATPPFSRGRDRIQPHVPRQSAISSSAKWSDRKHHSGALTNRLA